MEQDTELESALSAWEADVLPTIRILQIWAGTEFPALLEKNGGIYSHLSGLGGNEAIRTPAPIAQPSDFSRSVSSTT